MADPVTKKIDTLADLSGIAAANDKMVVIDASDTNAVTKTKLVAMNQLYISLPAQLAASVVENATIADNAVQTTKIKDYNVTLAKIEKSLNAYVLGNKASHATTPDGVVEISPSAANQVLLGSTGTTNTVDFGKVTVNHIGNINARTVIGNATNASAAPTAIAANTDGYVLRRSGDTIGFGKVKAAGIDSMTSAQLKAIVSDETGSGALVFGTSPTIGTATLNSPTLVTPALGTPASGVLTNCTGLPTAGLVDNSVTEAKLGTIKRTVVIKLNGSNDTVIAENNANLLAWAVTLNNFIVIDARINLATASSSGAVTVVLTNQGGTMATLSLAAGQTGMGASGTIASSYRTAVTNNFLSANVTAAGTGAKGLSITLVLQGVPA